MVGIFNNYADAEEAWRGAAQRTVDDAEMKYVVVHLLRLLEPDVYRTVVDGTPAVVKDYRRYRGTPLSLVARLLALATPA